MTLKQTHTSTLKDCVANYDKMISEGKLLSKGQMREYIAMKELIAERERRK